MKPKILLVRFDHIGDWVLFHSLWSKVVELNPQFEFHLLVNSTQLKIAQAWGKNHYHSITTIPSSALSYRNPAFIAFYLQLLTRNFQWMIQTMASPNPEIFSIFRLPLPFTKKVSGYLGDIQKGFEYQRNFEHLKVLSQLLPLNIQADWQNFSPEKPQQNPKKYIIFAPGASSDFRKWDIKNYQTLSHQLSQHCPDLIPVVMGAASDNLPVVTERNYPTSWPPNTEFLIGKSWQLIKEYLQQSALVICNDSAIYHAAIYLNQPTVVISNGNHFGRFIPYPLHAHQKVAYCFPNSHFYNPSYFADLEKETEERSTYNIQDITVNQVLEKALSLNP